MSPLQTALRDYLQLRRALGHQLEESGRQLMLFVAYLDEIGAETVTMDAVLAFVFDPSLNQASIVPSRRATAVRGFARYLSGMDAATEIPPAGLAPHRSQRRTPHLFSADDVAAVVRHARASTAFPFRAETLATLIQLLVASGMRVGEALRLDLSDIDWDNAVLLIRNTKFHKGRDLPVSASTIQALTAYASRQDRPRPAVTRLFVSLTGTPVIYTNFQTTFHAAVESTGIGQGSAIRPRIHDVRHSFAVRTVLGWHRAGLDVEALLPRLSTYLGHRDPRFTYHYLTATPELLGYAAARLEAWTVTP